MLSSWKQSSPCPHFLEDMCNTHMHLCIRAPSVVHVDRKALARCIRASNVWFIMGCASCDTMLLTASQLECCIHAHICCHTSSVPCPHYCPLCCFQSAVTHCCSVYVLAVSIMTWMMLARTCTITPSLRCWATGPLGTTSRRKPLGMPGNFSQ